MNHEMFDKRQKKSEVQKLENEGLEDVLSEINIHSFIKGKSLSILLGAGFSRPAGYPLACDLGVFFRDLTHKSFNINISDGDPYLLEEINQHLSEHHVLKDDFFEKLNIFKSRESGLNYELFYDFLLQNEIIRDNKNGDAGKILRIFSNLVATKIVDSNLRQFYEKDKQPSYLDKYSGFCDIINELSFNGNETHIFSLNHDLLLEHLSKFNYFNCLLSDGFTLDNSSYCYFYESGVQNKILPFFNNDFNGLIKLYKLHGSIDFFKFQGTDEDIIVRAESIESTANFSKMISDNKFLPEQFNFHPLLLSGVESKIKEYNGNNYYTSVFKAFQKQLDKTDILLTIGYGFRDIKINEMISKSCKEHPIELVILDPFPKSQVEIRKILNYCINISNIHILGKDKTIENLSYQDLMFD